ncbi:MAG: hypothetical protein KA479_12780 [Saprospiraceae bacterium]|nr:hypothetical protein [Saprospiraceae bacterium]
MHDIEPFFLWRDHYIASEDKQSPFYRRQYDEFYFTQKVYNYYIHPQWDTFGSATLYTKILFADYAEHYVILEFIGEWNDCLYNDIEMLKRGLIDPLIKRGIRKFILICENVYNFHGDDDSYYEEWWEDIHEDGGWICMVNTEKHVHEEMTDTKLYRYTHFGPDYNNIIWRPRQPEFFYQAIDSRLNEEVGLLD